MQLIPISQMRKLRFEGLGALPKVFQVRSDETSWAHLAPKPQLLVGALWSPI